MSTGDLPKGNFHVELEAPLGKGDTRRLAEGYRDQLAAEARLGRRRHARAIALRPREQQRWLLTLVRHFPAYEQAPPHRRQRAVFDGVSRKLVQDQGELLRERAAENDRHSVDLQSP